MVIIFGLVVLALGLVLLMLAVYTVSKDGAAREDSQHLAWLDYLARTDEDGVSETQE